MTLSNICYFLPLLQPSVYKVYCYQSSVCLDRRLIYIKHCRRRRTKNELKTKYTKKSKNKPKLETKHTFFTFSRKNNDANFRCAPPNLFRSLSVFGRVILCFNPYLSVLFSPPLLNNPTNEQFLDT